MAMNLAHLQAITLSYNEKIPEKTDSSTQETLLLNKISKYIISSIPKGII
ncbi:MAG: hypothetical protein QM396_02895 [Euryarchaeota archaeon]|nr:hypothetical protein [Euryarchaeota archaeon]HHT19715.1 hypothetical protein [Methanobacterium sp.]